MEINYDKMHKFPFKQQQRKQNIWNYGNKIQMHKMDRQQARLYHTVRLSHFQLICNASCHHYFKVF